MQSSFTTVQSTSPYFDEARSAEVVNARMSEDTDARLRQVMSVLVKHLHAAVKEIEPTHEEWFTAIRFLTETGQMCTDWRQEYILLSDILGISMLVDAINHRRPSGATPNTILGPFYIANAPEYPNGANICLDGKGEPMVVEGRVADIKGDPIPNAKLEVWQTNDDGALTAVLMVQFDINYVWATIICIIAGALIGAVQGYWIAFWRMPSFIVTLAGMLVFRGMTNLVLQGQSIGPFPDAFGAVSSGFIPDLFHGQTLHITSILLGVIVGALFFLIELRHRAGAAKHGVESGSFSMFVTKNVVLTALIVFFCYLLASYRGLPTVLVIMGVLIGVYTFIMNRTTIGRRIYAVGGNAKAARLSGVSVPAVSFLTFVNMGVLAALAGLIFAARLNSGTPKAGTGFELDVIAACFIGGASASGGVGKVVGAVVGAFIMGVMNNGMSIMGIGVDYQQVIKGIVLLAAVFVDVYNKNKA